jgi:hypothetical protein
LILDDVIEDMEFPNWNLGSLPKKAGGKSKRILYQSFPKGHFFSVYDKVWQKPKQKSSMIVHPYAILAALLLYS